VSSTVDANVLLYASDTASRFHGRAVELVRRLAMGPDLLYLFWPVAMAYLRISTHPAVFERPLDADAAMGNVEALLARRHVRAPGEDEGFWDLYRSVAAGVVVRGNLVPDAHLVALIRQHGVGTLWSHDRDFRKFQEIRVRDPFRP